MRGTDFPGSTVVSRFEALAMDHGFGFFQGVQIAEVRPLVEHFADHGVDHLAHQPGGLAAFIQINPEHFDSLVHWLNENPAHLKAFNELGQIWISTGIALAREIGQPLSDLERDQPPLMVH